MRKRKYKYLYLTYAQSTDSKRIKELETAIVDLGIEKSYSYSNCICYRCRVEVAPNYFTSNRSMLFLYKKWEVICLE